MRQYAAPLRRFGIHLTDHSRGARGLFVDTFRHWVGRQAFDSRLLKQFDFLLSYGRMRTGTLDGATLWLQRDYFPYRLLDESNPKVLEMDDALWVTVPQFGRALRRVDAVNVGNDFLAEWARGFNKNVHVTPTSIDVERFRNDRPMPEDFVIAWSGQSSSFRYLEDAEGGIAALMRKYPDVKLRVIADRRPILARVPAGRLCFMPWSPESEVEGLKDISVGIMPLWDTERERGKCAFKMLQYMSMARPVVVSPVGVNAEVLAQGACGLAARLATEWYDALEYYYLDREEAVRAGEIGRGIVVQRYSVDASVRRLAAIFRSV